MAEDKSRITSLVANLKTKGTQSALAKVIVFPVIMLVCYLILMFFFRANGGYKPVALIKGYRNILG